jgi:hypothetical protein
MVPFDVGAAAGTVGAATELAIAVGAAGVVGADAGGRGRGIGGAVTARLDPAARAPGMDRGGTGSAPVASSKPAVSDSRLPGGPEM